MPGPHGVCRGRVRDRTRRPAVGRGRPGLRPGRLRGRVGGRWIVVRRWFRRRRFAGRGGCRCPPRRVRAIASPSGRRSESRPGPGGRGRTSIRVRGPSPTRRSRTWSPIGFAGSAARRPCGRGEGRIRPGRAPRGPGRRGGGRCGGAVAAGEFRRRPDRPRAARNSRVRRQSPRGRVGRGPRRPPGGFRWFRCRFEIRRARRPARACRTPLVCRV